MSKNDILLLILFTIPLFTLIGTEITGYLKNRKVKKQFYEEYPMVEK